MSLRLISSRQDTNRYIVDAVSLTDVIPGTKIQPNKAHSMFRVLMTSTERQDHSLRSNFPKMSKIVFMWLTLKGYTTPNIYPMIFLLYLHSWMIGSLLTSTCRFKYAPRPLNQRLDKSEWCTKYAYACVLLFFRF